MPTRRQQQISEFLREEVSQIIQRELDDPRLGILSITRVEVSPDLRYARIFVSELGTEEERAEALQALEGASGFIRHLLKPRMRTRHIPELSFRLDRSLEHAEQIARTLNMLNRSEQNALDVDSTDGDSDEGDESESPR